MNSAFTLRRLAFAGVLSMITLGSACAEIDPTTVAAENAASARFAVTSVPADVSCIRITAAGNPTVHTLVDVTPGQPASFNLTGQPLGVVAFSAEAFPSICAVVGAGTVATWVSDPVTVTLTAGVAAQISLTLHENGLAGADIDFTSGLTCHAPTLPCLVNSDCCSGTCYPNGTCAGACSANGLSCSQSADCCAGQCANNLCCVPQGNACGTGADCCSGNCAGGTCGGPLPSTCGDAILSGAEQCDDGNTVSGDGCSSTCQIEQPPPQCFQATDCPGVDTECQSRTCAAGICGFAYAFFGSPVSSQFPGDCQRNVCDGAGSTVVFVDDTDVLADGNPCTIDNCSNGSPFYFNAPVGLACDPFGGTCDALGQCSPAVPSVCGNGLVEPGEQCDSTPGCTVSCTIALICGDGFLAGTEQCDDGNLIDGDGCTSTCTFESALELEPNNTPTQALANGAFPVNQLWAASIAPLGDNDYFLVHLPQTVDLKIETFDGNGPGSCANIDTVVYLYAADGATQLAWDDDNGINFCSLLSSTTQPGARHLLPGDYYVRVQRYNNNNVISAYDVRVTYNATCGNGLLEGFEACDGGASCDANCNVITAICGDGITTASESCDDGNAISGDGCSTACGVEAGFLCSGTPSVCVVGP
jgi:cysteine-rich repeat protein